MINYVNSVISARCEQITTAGHLDSVSIALFILINGEPASSNKVSQGCSSSVGSDRGSCTFSTGGSLVHIIHFTITQSCNPEMEEKIYAECFITLSAYNESE